MEHYFDYAASSPPFPQALQEFCRVSEEMFANPSSPHFYGQRAYQLLRDLKEKLRDLCQWGRGEVVVTSGGTESNNLVIRGLMDGNPEKRMVLPYDVHSSMWFAREIYEGRVDFVIPDQRGQLSLSQVEKTLTKDTILLSITHGCNETGVIHPLEPLAKLCEARGIFLHLDGTQAMGHLPLNLCQTPIHFYTFSAHKFGGPRGVGGILTRGDKLGAQICGGGQEGGLRSGTENLPGLAGAVKALELSLQDLPKEMVRLRSLAVFFLDKLSQRGLQFQVNSDIENGLPGLLSLSFSGLLASQAVMELSLKGFGISTGSACYFGETEPSRMLIGRGRTLSEALGTLRISLGRHTTQQGLTELATALSDVIQKG